MSKRARDEDADDTGIEDSIDAGGYSSSSTIECVLPPCHLNPVYLASYLDYENHIRTFHDNRCCHCFKNFPSDEFLNIHIDENHNPFIQIQKERGDKVYKCFKYCDNGCRKICASQRKRNLHMIDKHGYPKNFNFDIINRGMSSDTVSLLMK